MRKRGLLPQQAGRGGGSARANACGTASGPIDSVSHWHSIARSRPSATVRTVDGPVDYIHSASPRSEILLSGFASDRSSAAIRVGPLKLLVGRWGSPRWCDLNTSGFSPLYPAPPAEPSAPGGEGGVVCADLLRSHRIDSRRPSAAPLNVPIWHPALDLRTDPDPALKADADAALQLRIMEAHSRSSDLPRSYSYQRLNPTFLTDLADVRTRALATTLRHQHDAFGTDDTRTGSTRSAGSSGAADPYHWEGWDVQLYDVVADPRELANLAGQRHADVTRLLDRLLWWNMSRVQNMHRQEDPAGRTLAKVTGCWQPWRTYSSKAQ